MNQVLNLIGRTSPLFEADRIAHEQTFSELVMGAKFLVIGGAGTIGQAVSKALFAHKPHTLHIVDISENNLVELVRDIRSSLGYIDGDFRTFALDFGSLEFLAMFDHEGPYDYVLNLSALKHVRSEEDAFTLMRMIDVNITNTERLRGLAESTSAKKFFSISTDKATDPVNMMGCSKRIMELFLLARAENTKVSTARFANVAFSDGSLLHGFAQRLAKNQPLSAPNDTRRYFITQEESGFLCLASCLLGANAETFFPLLDETHDLISFSDIAVRYLESIGYKAVECESEQQARESVYDLSASKQWPVYFFSSDTTGEKATEEFFTDKNIIDWNRFKSMGVIDESIGAHDYHERLTAFESNIAQLRSAGKWTKSDLVTVFKRTVPEFSHFETGKYLDGRM